MKYIKMIVFSLCFTFCASMLGTEQEYELTINRKTFDFISLVQRDPQSQFEQRETIELHQAIKSSLDELKAEGKINFDGEAYEYLGTCFSCLDYVIYYLTKDMKQTLLLRSQNIKVEERNSGVLYLVKKLGFSFIQEGEYPKTGDVAVYFEDKTTHDQTVKAQHFAIMNDKNRALSKCGCTVQAIMSCPPEQLLHSYPGTIRFLRKN